MGSELKVILKTRIVHIHNQTNVKTAFYIYPSVKVEKEKKSDTKSDTSWSQLTSASNVLRRWRKVMPPWIEISNVRGEPATSYR